MSEFETWWGKQGIDDYVARSECRQAWDARQPEIDRLAAELAELRAAATRFVGVIRDRHYGRMPDEVQSAFDGVAALLARTPTTEAPR
jgi:cell division protein FtsB